MHRHNVYNNRAYNNNNYLSVICHEPGVKRSLCILQCVSSILHPSNLNAALVSAYIFIDLNF